MYRGTTPTITINCDIDVSEFVTMWVTFRTQQLATYAPPKQVEVTKHLGDEGVDATDKVVTVSLTQADTLLLGSLSPDEDQQVEVQTVRRPAYETLRSSRRPEGHHDEGVCRRG